MTVPFTPSGEAMEKDIAETLAKRPRPKAPRITWMLQVKPFGVFTIDAEVFIKDGGSLNDPSWIGVYAENEAHARHIGELLLINLRGKL